jgi:DNA replication protein DnaC
VTTPLSEPAADAAIDAACRTLALPTVRAEAAALADAAARDRLTHRGYLAELLSAETDARAARRRQRRLHEARFPRHKTLAGFDLDAAASITPALLADLATCAWIDRAEPVVAVGDSGTGKTHLLIGLGVAACEQGRRVRYTTAAGLVNELAEAADDRTLSRTIARYGRLALLLIDELGYLHLDPRGAELLFQVITERDERASIAVASNAPFSEWGATFPDPRLAAAVVDRLTYNAHIIQTGHDSYRLRTTRRGRTTPRTRAAARSPDHHDKEAPTDHR